MILAQCIRVQFWFWWRSLPQFDLNLTIFLCSLTSLSDGQFLHISTIPLCKIHLEVVRGRFAESVIKKSSPDWHKYVWKEQLIFFMSMPKTRFKLEELRLERLPYLLYVCSACRFGPPDFFQFTIFAYIYIYFISIYIPILWSLRAVS